MSGFIRYAIYSVPPEGALARFGASWLGWDLAAGMSTPHLAMPGIEAVTMTPRKYGFHATLKPPFRLAPGQDASALTTAVDALAAASKPAHFAGLHLSQLGSFLALTPRDEAPELIALAAKCVRDLDAFRAPASAQEIARRSAAGLTPAQEANLAQWGYPYVMSEFCFHMTLSGPLSPAALALAKAYFAAHLPPLPAPDALTQIALVGERADGMFQLIHRYTLTG